MQAKRARAVKSYTCAASPSVFLYGPRQNCPYRARPSVYRKTWLLLQKRMCSERRQLARVCAFVYACVIQPDQVKHTAVLQTIVTSVCPFVCCARTTPFNSFTKPPGGLCARALNTKTEQSSRSLVAAAAAGRPSSRTGAACSLGCGGGGGLRGGAHPRRAVPGARTIGCLVDCGIANDLATISAAAALVQPPPGPHCRFVCASGWAVAMVSPCFGPTLEHHWCL